MKYFIIFVSGLLFALGLGISGMTQPHIVRGFLDVFGNWDPRLLGVMAGAILVHSFSYYFITKWHAPIFDSEFHLPTRKDIDLRLIGGAVLFGLGWGWAGICPGPGIVSIASGNREIYYFIGALFLGMKTFQLIDKKRK